MKEKEPKEEREVKPPKVIETAMVTRENTEPKKITRKL
jgi:hypothetical protein